MGKKSFISGLISGLILGLGSFFSVIFTTDPQVAGWGIKFLAYLGLFVGLACAMSLSAYFLLRRVTNRQFHQLAGLAFIEGIFISFVVVGLVVAQSNSLALGPLGVLILAVFISGQTIIIKNKDNWHI